MNKKKRTHNLEQSNTFDYLENKEDIKMTSSDFHGGSLNRIEVKENRVIKSYFGNIERGSEKLIKEYEWLKKIPYSLRKEYPSLFPDLYNEYQEEILGHKAEIQITLLPRISLSKAIIRELISPIETRHYFQIALSTLIEKIYPLRYGEITARQGYLDFHKKRIDFARGFLEQLPYLQTILNARQVYINGIECPSFSQFSSWLDLNAPQIFHSTQLVAGHGNFHFDNILIDPNKEPSVQNITFIDPRGELLCFPHYDIAKVLLTLEGFYDELNYNGFEILIRKKGNDCVVDLSINTSRSKYYTECLNELQKWITKFAKVEKVNESDFLYIIYTVECIHVFSLCFYHAYGPNSNPDKTKAFLSIFFLLGRRIIKIWDKQYNLINISNKRLEIGRENYVRG